MEIVPSNFDKICRTCLKTNAEPLSHIFDSNLFVFQDQVTTSQVLIAVSTLRIKADDPLPKGICTICLAVLEKAYRFQEMCKHSDLCLRNALTGEIIEAKFTSHLTALMSSGSVPNPLDEIELVDLKTEDAIEEGELSKGTCETNTLRDQKDVRVDSWNDLSGNNGDDVHSEKQAEDFSQVSDAGIEIPNMRNRRNACNTCEVCGKSFDRQHRLNRHTNVHKREALPHECTYCKQQLMQTPDVYKCKERPRILKTVAFSSNTPIYQNNVNLRKSYSWDVQNPLDGIELINLKTEDDADKGELPGETSKLNDLSDEFAMKKENETNILSEQNDEQEFDSLDDTEEQAGASLRKADVEIEIPNPRNRRNACHTCDACGKSFDRQHRLNRHMNVHKTEGRPYECTNCKRRFTKEAQLQRHAITHEKHFQQKTEQNKQNPDGYKCTECPRIFLKQVSLASHTRTHRKNVDLTKSYQCEICSKVFERLYRLTRHRKLHEEHRKLSCDICGKTFGLSSHLIDHLNRHSGIKPHVCHYCDKSFLQACTLKDHLRTHTGEQPFLCSECGKAFNNASNLRQHQLRHSGIKRYQCPECPSKFTCKSGLCSHMSTHQNQKPYVCDICGSRFTKHYSLKKHERIHTGEKPYQCDYCEMRFNCTDHMKRHRRTHTGEKPYACRYCERTFAQSNDMIKHLRSHVGENVYKCEQCNASFRLSTELKKHITEHYKVDRAQTSKPDQRSNKNSLL